MAVIRGGGDARMLMIFMTTRAVQASMISAFLTCIS